MSNNHYETNYTKQYKKRLNKKESSLQTISHEFKNKSNIINSNSNNGNASPIQIKVINLSNNGNVQTTPGQNKIFKNIKLYRVSKQQNPIKKRNMPNKKINNISSTYFIENNNNNIQNNNNTIHNNNNLNNNSKNNKSLPKSKSNKVFLTPFQNYKIHSRNRNINNTLMNSISNSGHGKSCNNLYNKKIINKKSSKYQINLMNHTISLSSQKPLKLNENRNKRGDSGSSAEDKIKIQRLNEEKENLEKRIKYKDDIIKEQENLILLLKKNEVQLKEQIEIISNKCEDLKEKYQKLNTENKILKEKLFDFDKNINFLKEKEVKLMRVLYLIKEKGIDINTVLNEVKKDSNIDYINNSEISKDSNSSSMTIYFPDKINMKSTMETKGADKIPKIDFNQIPEYSFQSDENDKNDNYDEELQNQYEFDFHQIGFNKYGSFGFHQNSV